MDKDIVNSLEDFRKECNIPKDDVLIILHTTREKVLELENALEKLGYKNNAYELVSTKEKEEILTYGGLSHMNILITGGAGYIGSILSDILRKNNDVIVIDKMYFRTDPLGINKDVRDLKLKDFIGIDCVIDLACISNDPSCDLDPQITQEININAAIQTAQLAKKAGVRRYIYSSTCSVYGDGTMLNLTEKDITNPISLYAKSKLITEWAVLKLNDNNFKVVALRNGTVFGYSPRMRFDLVINTMTASAWKNKKIIVNDGSQWRPHIHIKDVCEAFIFMAKTCHTGIYNIVGQNMKILDTAKLIQNMMDCNIEIIPENKDKRNYSVSGEKAKNIGYYSRYSLEEGIMEIKDKLNNGIISPDDPKTKTIEYYKQLFQERMG